MKTRMWCCASALEVVLVVTFAVAAGPVSAQQNQGLGQNRGHQDQKAGNSERELPNLQPSCSLLPPGGVCLQFDDGKGELLHVQGNVYMVAGAGANITVEVGDQFVTVVDAGIPEKSGEVLDAIRSLTDKHILYIIDTSADEDHTGGNENLSKSGWALPSPVSGRVLSDKTGLVLPAGAAILAHMNVLHRMSAPTGQEAPTPEGSWPTDIYEEDDWKLYNGEAVYIYHAPNAHTDGDSYVFFRRSDVVSTGDILTLASYPVVKAERGGSINGLIDALNQIIELLEPEAHEEGGTYVIPGHGRICDRNDVVNYRDMVTIIRGRIDAMVKEGMTLKQVKDAKPTFDYDGIYGSTTSPWTTDVFIEAVYQELSKTKNQQAKNPARVGGR
jgi:glyoxylase-like metal-dependent hydrolase (beta-lactamase superfamily II)